jgi:hypothetical protein
MVQAAMGTLSILPALVLGFLINSAKVKFETVSIQIEQFASDLAMLDRELRNFGPSTVDTRDLLRRYAAAKIAATWPEEPRRPTFDDPTSLRLLDQFQTAPPPHAKDRGGTIESCRRDLSRGRCGQDNLAPDRSRG